MDKQNTVGKKRNLGRAARRRRKKVLEIAKAESEFAAAAANDSESLPPVDSLQSTKVLPTDRNILRGPVVESRMKLGWNTDDENQLCRQLGFVPGNAIRVCCRRTGIVPNDVQKALAGPNATADEPVVLQLYPLAVRDEFSGGKAGGRKFKSRKRRRTNPPTSEALLGDHDNASKDPEPSNGAVLEPFPTMYWLTHPLLRLWVSKLEVNGFGVELQNRLAGNKSFAEQMKLAHLAYGKARFNLLTESDVQNVKDRKWENALGDARGVAGIRNPVSVKCLHAHTAHYLSGDAGSQDNVVGAWVLKSIHEMVQTKSKGIDPKQGGL